MSVCAAYGCKNKPQNKLKGITFHHFPKDLYRRQQWILAVRRANWMPNKFSAVCSKHFEDDMVDRTSIFRTSLKPNAVPTIFDGLPPLSNQELLKPKTEVIPPCPVKQEFKCVEPLEDISNDKNRILVVPEGLDVQQTFYNSNGCSNDNKNIVIIKDEKDYKAVLNCDNDADDNRVIIVSDGTNMKTEWCGNGGEDSHPDEETSSYDPNSGVQSCKSDIMDHSKFQALISYDPEFYGRRIKSLNAKVKKLQSKKKILLQSLRRKRKKIATLKKEFNRIKKNALTPKCSTRPVVHVIAQVINN